MFKLDGIKSFFSEVSIVAEYQPFSDDAVKDLIHAKRNTSKLCHVITWYRVV